MSKSQPRNKIFCAIRRKWVTALPEEEIRQYLLKYLIDELGYPAEAIAVELALKELPHLCCKDNSELPYRRIDILCFGKNLTPLLLIECKAVPLNDGMLAQMMGYNHYVEARYVAIANGKEVWTAWYDEEKQNYQLFQGLPAYTSK